MKSRTHLSNHLIAREKEGSHIKPMEKYKLNETNESLKDRHCCGDYSGTEVTAVRPHPDQEGFWQVETGQGLIWVKEEFLETINPA